MKTGKPFLIGCLVFPLILIVAFGIGFCSSAGKLGSGVSVPSNAWLVLDPAGLINDYNEIQSSGIFGTASPVLRSSQPGSKPPRQTSGSREC